MSEPTPPYVIEQALRDPMDFAAGRVHDWRNHVGDRVVAAWDSFTPEQKVAIAGDADDRASAEHWE